MTTASYKNRAYSRFIPSEEISNFAQWDFGAMDGGEAFPAGLDTRSPTESESEESLELKALREAAFAEGLAQGHAQAQHEFQQQMDLFVSGHGADCVHRMNALVEGLNSRLKISEQLVAEGVVALACAIAKQVVRREISLQGTGVMDVASEAVGMLVQDGQVIKVRMNPEDLALIQAGEIAAEQGLSVKYVRDETLSVGSVLAEAGGALVDGSVERRWARAVARLGLEDAWQQEGGYATD